MVIKGVGIGRGVAVGPVIRMAAALPEPSDAPRADSVSAESEIERVTKSLALVNADLNRRAEEAANGDEGAKQAAPILQAIAMFASDPALAQSINTLIEQGKTAERAVLEGFGAVEEMFKAIGGYQGERAADLHDVGQRVIADLMGVPAPGVPVSDTPFVLVAEDLSPGRHRRPRPGQDPRHRHLAGRPDLAHGHSGPCPRHRGRRVRRRRRRPEERRDGYRQRCGKHHHHRAERRAGRRRRSREGQGREGQGAARQAGRHQGRLPHPAARQRRQALRRQDRAGVRCGRRRPVPFRVPVHRQRRTAEC